MNLHRRRRRVYRNRVREVAELDGKVLVPFGHCVTQGGQVDNRAAVGVSATGVVRREGDRPTQPGCGGVVYPVRGRRGRWAIDQGIIERNARLRVRVVIRGVDPDQYLPGASLVDRRWGVIPDRRQDRILDPHLPGRGISGRESRTREIAELEGEEFVPLGHRVAQGGQLDELKLGVGPRTAGKLYWLHNFMSAQPGRRRVVGPACRRRGRRAIDQGVIVRDVGRSGRVGSGKDLDRQVGPRSLIEFGLGGVPDRRPGASQQIPPFQVGQVQADAARPPITGLGSGAAEQSFWEPVRQPPQAARPGSHAVILESAVLTSLPENR